MADYNFCQKSIKHDGRFIFVVQEKINANDNGLKKIAEEQLN